MVGGENYTTCLAYIPLKDFISIHELVFQISDIPILKKNLTKEKKFGIGSESPRTTVFNMYYNGIKCTLEMGARGFRT